LKKQDKANHPSKAETRLRKAAFEWFSEILIEGFDIAI